MDYPKDVCSMLFDNPEIVEEPSLTEYVELKVFKGINEGIKRQLDHKPLRTRFGLVSGDEEENEDTFFANFDWPVSDTGDDIVGFRLWENDSNINEWWLSHALGVNGGKLCFDFFVEARKDGPSKYKAKQKLEELYNKNDNIKKAGFIHHQRGSIYLPFTLDVDKLKIEFPKLHTCLAPMFKALELIVGLSKDFDNIVKEIYPS